MHELRTRLADRRKDARDRGEDGFTLIELMVVILIIAILIAIAIPTFLGARQKAQDRAAQSNLRNALTAAKTAYVDSQNYNSDVTNGVYASIEPSLQFTESASTGQGVISVAIPTTDTSGDAIILAAKSASGTCYYIEDNTGASATGNPGTFYGKQTTATCSATSPPSGGITATAW
jgi:type IV pilus assembly protein PilA